MRSLPLLAAVAATATVLTGGCAPIRSHQGYIVDADLVNAIHPGIDNRQSVLATLGQPSFASQFNKGDWYYIARDSKNLAYKTPQVDKQLTLQISFDPAGNVSAIRKSGEELAASIDPSRKTTPTLGRSRSFFEDLFGNIGTVGAAGTGAGAGGGRDQP